jgi:hypothetical protein
VFQYEILENYQLFERLKPVAMPTEDRPCCLPGTRKAIIEEITDLFVNVEHGNRIFFWLHGLSGTGKSTISTTVANISRDLQRLAAFIFFNRDVRERASPTFAIPTLAYNLSLFDPRIGEAVATTIRSILTVVDAPLPFQFQKLIEEPLRAIESEYFGGPIVVIMTNVEARETAG